MTRLLRILSLTCIGAGLLLPASSSATTVVALSDPDLARGAKTIVHGDVVSRESFSVAENGRIYTEYRFAVRDLLKGTAEKDGSVVFREWGGEANGIRYYVPGAPGYDVGEEVVTFLGDTDPKTGVGFTYGLSQGKFVVRRDAASGKALLHRDLHGLSVVGPDGRPSAEPAGDDGRELETFEAQIRAEVAK
jgi:hypothetical protein